MASQPVDPDYRYTRAAIALHWTIAALILANIGLAWTWDAFMHSPDPARKAIGFNMVDAHKSFGLTVLALSLIRLALRLAQGFRKLPDSTPAWQRFAGRATHVWFYVLMILTPALGWALASSGPFPLAWFGIPFPKLPVPHEKALGDQLASNHGLAATLILITLALHVAGALKHQLVDRDLVLHRMLPWVKRPA